VGQGRRVVLRFLVRAGQGSSAAPVRGALVRLAGGRAVTGPSGRAKIVLRFGHSGRRVAVASARGYRSGRVTVRVGRSSRFDD
jgi:hypothetical protein